MTRQQMRSPGSGRHGYKHSFLSSCFTWQALRRWSIFIVVIFIGQFTSIIFTTTNETMRNTKTYDDIISSYHDSETNEVSGHHHHHQQQQQKVSTVRIKSISDESSGTKKTITERDFYNNGGSSSSNNNNKFLRTDKIDQVDEEKSSSRQ